MTSRINRRKFGKVLVGAAAATVGVAIITRRSVKDHPGEKLTPEEFFRMSYNASRVYGAYPTTYIPPHLRSPNTDGSCVHLATANIFLSMGMPEYARSWVAAHRGGEYSSRHIRRMTAEGLYFAVETDGNPEFIDYFAGNTGEAAQRVMGCSYMARHVMNVLDIDPAGTQGARAYLLNNQRRSGVWSWDSPIAAEVPRGQFLTEWDRRGGWAFTIVGANTRGIVPPNPPYPYVRGSRPTV